MPRKAAKFVALVVLETGMKSPVFGRCREAYRPSTTDARSDGTSPATLREYQDGSGFFDRFEGLLTPSDLAGKDVLDIGSGYGGRTIYYAIHCGCRSTVGLEIKPRMVSLSTAAAGRLAPAASLSFVCGIGESLPFGDSQFDAVLSYDVFEHVDNLEQVLSECHRVLRPGGRLYALFPPYYGPRAHHLDFITTLPYLHYFFSAPVLVDAANIVIDRHPEIERSRLPTVGTDDCLPTLNGTTERAFRHLVSASPWAVEEIRAIAIGSARGGRLLHRTLQGLLDLQWPVTRDALTGTIRCILRRP